MDSENSKLEETVILHIARMKAEIIELKDTIQRFTQSDHVAGELEILKQEIEKLKTENNEIVNKIKVLEKELKSYNVDESDEENSGNAEPVCLLLCNYCSYQCASKEEYQSHIKIHQKEDIAEEFKCDKCGSMYDNLNTLTKHMNTRHQSGIEQKDTTHTEFKQKEDSNNEQKGDLCICPNCKKEFKTRFILIKHFHEDHVDEDPHLYHKNMDILLDMYEANHEDSDDDDSSSNIV